MNTGSPLQSLAPIDSPAASLLTRAKALWPRVVTAFESPWVAYPLLFLLQLKIIWGMWAMRDVTTGDTCAYFTTAWQWYTGGDVIVAWSPLYTAFYGSFLFWNSDPVWATFAHRIVIVLTTTLLVLAVLRQLLPPAIAWLCSTWWAVLPIVFNTLYEVHLFATIPVMFSWLLLLTAKGPWRRAASLGVLAASAVLVRNELSIPTCMMSLILVVYEWRRIRSGEGTRYAGTLLAYATSVIVATGLCYGAYAASAIKGDQLSKALHGKHTVNMAQVYAFGYQQRHPEWTHSAWLECYGLMQDTFGQRTPTLREMIAANPAAVWEHFLWNVSLTPNGLQLLLFDRAAGKVTPDYDSAVLSRLQSRRAVILSVVLLAIWSAGFVVLVRNRCEWWEKWLSARALGWAAMFAMATVIPLVILTQRPRPSYLFAFAVLLIAITGMCFYAATNRWRIAERLRTVMPVLMVGFLALVPRYFTQAKATPRPTANSVQRLLPYREMIAQPDVITLLPQRESIGWFIYPNSRKQNPQPIQAFAEIMEAAKPGETFAQLMERKQVDYVYLDEWCLAELTAGKCGEASEFIEAQPVPGWELVAVGTTLHDRWRLYHRVK